MNKPMIVILNPASGSVDENYRPQIEKALQIRGAEFEVRETTKEKGGGELAAEAVREGATHLVACGGDGTVMAIVNGIGKNDPGSESQAQPSQVTLSIIPGGTANLLAAALDIPTTIDEAVAVAVAGEDREIDLGCCGEHLFALGLGLGLTERLVSQASAQQKEKFGKLAYAIAMLKELGARPHTFSFKLDDKRSRRAKGVAIVIANAGEIGGGVRFAPRAKMDDGLLDLCILHRFYFRDFLRMAIRGLLGQLQQDRAVSFFQARRVEIRSDPPLDLQIDGEEVDKEVPLVAEVKPKALRVRVPVPKQGETNENMKKG
ncbi:MAG: diacylglycerol kinase family lipid kinase [Abitibacteriaceae bacterium]|nr:diacylglycerol kinase family lipid kinase [Abditibacteriaceae bacterium]MBV9865003.1 diacylglycerol kinase family lipid kinase [Abditibacteriaceae bacterium]